MFISRTDLALEAREFAIKTNKSFDDGIIVKEFQDSGFKITEIEILTKKASEATGKPIGIYDTIDIGKIWDDTITRFVSATKVFARTLKNAVGNNKHRRILVVGLGNITITADALGPKALSHTIITRHLKAVSPELFKAIGNVNISGISPGVLSQTGVETLEIVRGTAEAVEPDIVIAIDALAASDIRRLGTTVQVSNVGITPGSGIGNARESLSLETIGVPVISIGVPTVVDAITISENFANKSREELDLREYENMLVTPKDCDRIVTATSKIIGHGINTAFHNGLSYEEMLSVCC